MTIGLLFPGEMGAAVGAAATATVLWAREGRSEATARRAAGFEDAGTVAALVARSDVVVSICPPAVAEETAERVTTLGFRGLYVDANAVSPARMQRIAARFERCVDGSIMAKTGIHLYLSGSPDDVELVRGLFREPVETIPLPGGIGAASALKMAFGGWNKISVALAAQALAIAHAYGVEAHLADEGVEPARVQRAAGRAWRWAPEMREVGDTCAALGLSDEIARAAADLFERWQAHRDDASVPVEQLLEAISPYLKGSAAPSAPGEIA
jgi:3-hydroxyisobutyrate dehydrogenase-like beta-hydroxyacid dehydrogenase